MFLEISTPVKVPDGRFGFIQSFSDEGTKCTEGTFQCPNHNVWVQITFGELPELFKVKELERTTVSQYMMENKVQ